MKVLRAPWLNSPELQHLFTLFEKEGATLRLVGGAVRDALLELPVSDIDLAVDRDPHWALDLLKKNDVKAIPTGIDHGTITAVLDRRPYQITTLRVDIKTFGRKAEVAFTEDWVQDALRRDFTMNAIYADKNGHLFDPVDGLKDLEQRHVRFIGKAAQRIKEDYLRILRFFRFSARFGQEPYDPEGLQACAQYASHLPHLARERVTEEFLKILELPSPLYTFHEMSNTGVLAYILHPGTWKDLDALIEIETALKAPPIALLRLAAFHPQLVEIKAHLRLSKKQEATLSFLLNDHPRVSAASFKLQAYQWGKSSTIDLAFLQTARRMAAQQISSAEGIAFLGDLRSQFSEWTPPTFPLSGDDIISRGIQEGHKVGQHLKDVESWWIAQDMQPDRTACLAYLETLL